jgi:hypothetical protein
MTMARDVDPTASCLGKSAYQTQMQAQAAIGRRRRNNKDRAPLNAYRCRYCGQWHVGHPKPKTIAERKREELVHEPEL